MQNMLSWREDHLQQLRLKAVEMLRSSTHLVKSHGDDLGLETGMNTVLWKTV